MAALQLPLVLLAACALSASGAAGGEDALPLDDVVDSARGLLIKCESQPRDNVPLRVVAAV